MSSAPALSRREMGKARRREAIIQSACLLLGRMSYAEMSVVMIADGAGLSPATVFNLFGSKAAVLEAAVERDADVLVREVFRRRGDGLSLILEAIRLTAGRYGANAPVYRNAVDALVRSSAETAPDLWLRLVRMAMSDGGLDPSIDAMRTAQTLAYIEAGVLLHWLADAISTDGLERELTRAVAAVLTPLATMRGARQLASCVAGRTSGDREGRGVARSGGLAHSGLVAAH